MREAPRPEVRANRVGRSRERAGGLRVEVVLRLCKDIVESEELLRRGGRVRGGGEGARTVSGNDCAGGEGGAVVHSAAVEGGEGEEGVGVRGVGGVEEVDSAGGGGVGGEGGGGPPGEGGADEVWHCVVGGGEGGIWGVWGIWGIWGYWVLAYCNAWVGVTFSHHWASVRGH